jgi:fluoride exporter
MQLLYIALFGALGSLSRYGVGLLARAWFGETFPWGTLLINTLGSFLLGLIVSLALAGRVSESTRLAIGVGFCGAFTTFSTFELETQQLFAQGRGLEAFGYATISFLCGFGAIVAGQWLSHSLA